MASPHALNFAVLLKRLRRAAGLSQEQLARRSSFSVSYIGQLERGLHTPVRTTLEILAQALELGAADRGALLGALPPRRETPRLPSPLELPPPARLVGRAGELERITRHLAGDGPPLLVLTGEPGIGKTRLLRAALERAGAAGLPALVGGCHRRSGQEPYEPLLGALLGYLRQVSPARQRLDLRGSSWLVRLVPELAEATVVPLPQWILPPEQERRLMFAAVRQFLANVAGTGRVLLVLDDLHWAGMDALDLLGTLLRPAPEPGLRVLAGLRDTEMRADAPLALLLADLEREGLSARAPLGTLSRAEGAMLLDHLLAQGAATSAPAPHDALARQRILEQSDGVPLYLVSCAKGWRAAAEADGDAATAATPDIPDTITQSIQQRVLALPQVARQALEVAALVGRVAPRALLAAALEPLGFASEHLVLALEAASAAGLLVEDGPAAHAFAHDLIREALLAQMSAARRQALHGRIALALEHLHAANLDAASAQIALHHVRGDDPGRAIPYLERAGDYARARYANAEAESHYRDLVGLLDSSGDIPLAARARAKLGAVLSDLARFDEARATLERALWAYRVSADQDGMLAVTARIGQIYGATGAADEGIARLRQVLRELDTSQPSPGLAALYATLADLHYVRDQYHEQLAAAERAADAARALADGRVLAAAAKERGLALLNLGRVREARDVLSEAVTLAEAASDLWTLCFALRGLSVVHVARGELDDGYRTAQRAVECAELSGAPTMMALAAQRRGTVAFFMGRWEETRADGARALAFLDQIGPSLTRLYPLLILGRLALAQGQVDAARAHLREAITLAERSGNIYGLRAAHSALAELDLLEGDPAAARARLEALLDRPGLQEGDVIALLILLAWACVDLGDEPRAADFLARSEARAAPERMRATLVDTLRVRALLALRQRRWRAAEDALAESLALAQSIAYPYAEAKALHTYGLLHSQRGQRERARARLEAALAIFNQLGERLYAAHAERALAALRERSA